MVNRRSPIIIHPIAGERCVHPQSVRARQQWAESPSAEEEQWIRFRSEYLVLVEQSQGREEEGKRCIDGISILIESGWIRRHRSSGTCNLRVRRARDKAARSGGLKGLEFIYHWFDGGRRVEITVVRPESYVNCTSIFGINMGG